MKIKLPDAYVIILSFSLLAMVATWLVPAGEYKFVENPTTHIKQVDPASFAPVKQHPVLPAQFFLYFPRGLEAAAEVFFMIVLVGGFLQIISDTGAIEAGLMRLITKLGGRELLIVPLVMLAMSLMGFAGILSNAVVAFIPLGLLLARRLRLDPVCGVAMTYLGCYSGFATSPMCPPTTLIAQKIAELPPVSGFTVRTVVWVIAFLITAFYVMRYARKVHADPSASLWPHFTDLEPVKAGAVPAFNFRRALVLLGLFGGFVLFGYGASKMEWSLRHLSAVMMAVGIFGGLVGGMNASRIVQSFTSGCRHMIYSAMIIGLAKSITLIMEDGRIIHTIVHALSAPLVNLPAMVAAQGMYLMSLGVHFFITSGSGQAYVTMPIMTPIADLVGLSRQTAVSAYLYGDGFINIIIPTSGVLMSVIAMSKIPYTKWLKFALPLCLMWIIVGSVAIAYSTYFGW